MPLLITSDKKSRAKRPDCTVGSDECLPSSLIYLRHFIMNPASLKKDEYNWGLMCQCQGCDDSVRVEAIMLPPLVRQGRADSGCKNAHARVQKAMLVASRSSEKAIGQLGKRFCDCNVYFKP